MASDIIDHPVLEALYRYWWNKRGGRPLPARHDIDPVEMGPRLLPHLLLCDLFDRGARVRFRLVGTHVVTRFGFDPTGQHLEEMPDGGYFAHLAALYHLSCRERAPVSSESRFRWGVNRRLSVRHLILPLATGGSEPTCSATPWGTPWATRPLVSVCGSRAARPAIISDMNTPMDSAVPLFWKVARIPEATPR